MLTLEIYEQALERAKTDEPLAAGLRSLARLNALVLDLDRKHREAQQEYRKLEEAIAKYMADPD